MSYDPFARGPFPVGVTTRDTVDPTRDDRPIAIEIWYPATDAYLGHDVAEETRDRFQLLPVFQPVPQDAVRDATPRGETSPIVLFSHGFGSHRRQSTRVCAHWASRGYVVAAVDHAGNTMHDMMQTTLAVRNGAPPPDGTALLKASIAHRPADMLFVLDELTRGVPGLAVDDQRIGVSGHSFGGWTTLMVAGREPRVAAALPLAPAGGATPLGGSLLHDALDFAWSRPVPTLMLAAERDSILPLTGMRELYARVPTPKHVSILTNADHMHFCDRAGTTHEMFRMMPPPGGFAAVAKTTPPFSELCPAEPAYLWARGLAAAHMDAHVRRDEAALAWLSGDVAGAFTAQGIVATFE